MLVLCAFGRSRSSSLRLRLSEGAETPYSTTRVGAVNKVLTARFLDVSVDVPGRSRKSSKHGSLVVLVSGLRMPMCKAPLVVVKDNQVTVTFNNAQSQIKGLAEEDTGRIRLC